jgi:hypothetical protein
MNKKYQTIMLAAALACGIHTAIAEEPEDVVIPLPPLPGVPDIELKLPVPPPLERLHNHIHEAIPPLGRLHERIHNVVFAPLKLLAQAAPPAVPAISVEPVPPSPAKPRMVGRASVSDEGAFFRFGSSSRSGRSLVIPKDDMDPETLAGTEEDLNVMALILDKAVDHKGDDDKKIMGIDVFTGSSGARNLFVEGHGAIFLLKTKLTLTPPPAAKKEESKAKQPTSSDWEDARRQLYGPNEWEREIHKALKGVPGLGGSPAPYDEERVNDLKNDVIESLKNASNIRGLKGDHTVTVVISGSGSSGGAAIVRRDSEGKSEKRVYAREEHGDGKRGAAMIVQAKKSDIDSFAKDGNEESFRKKVKVRVY